MLWFVYRPDALRVLRDPKARAALGRYFDIMENKKPAKFTIAKRIPVRFDSNTPLEKLWSIHEEATKKLYSLEKRIDEGEISLEELDLPEQSYMDLKAEITKRLMEKCCFCERRCGVNRFKGEKGYCKAGTEMLVSTYFEHLGEEPELVPSFTVFTIGCNFTCIHCQNWSISQWYEAGEFIPPEKLAAIIDSYRKLGCRNANLVGGEPTIWAYQWFEVFRHVKENVPVVWNSNAYYSLELAKLLAGFVDVYLLDFKYGNDSCALRLSNVPNYMEVVTRNHLLAKKHGELIIRVLVLPNHLDCCLDSILKWISENLGPMTRVNVMFQYRPEWRAHEVPELRRRLNEKEMEKSLELANKYKLENVIT